MKSSDSLTAAHPPLRVWLEPGQDPLPTGRAARAVRDAHSRRSGGAVASPGSEIHDVPFSSKERTRQ